MVKNDQTMLPISPIEGALTAAAARMGTVEVGLLTSIQSFVDKATAGMVEPVMPISAMPELASVQGIVDKAIAGLTPISGLGPIEGALTAAAARMGLTEPELPASIQSVVDKATAGMVEPVMPISAMPELASVQGIVDKAMAGLSPAAGLGPIQGAIAAARLGPLDAVSLPTPVIEISEAWNRRFTVVKRFAQRWKETALWFMLSSLSEAHLYDLSEKNQAEMEGVLLGALETVVVGGAYTRALASALDKAPYLTDEQRDDLQHGLEHAGEGDFARAMPPLMLGLEGALWSTARARSVLDEQRRLVDKPGKGVIRRVELVVRQLPSEDNYATFVCGRVFGDLGNPARHGEAVMRRRQVLFAIVAIAGWLDAFMNVPAREVLGQMLRDALATD